MGKFKLTFEDSSYALNLTAMGGLRDLYQFRGNSIFNPDYNATSPAGKLPYGFNELMPGLFQLYKVYASKIKVYATIKVPVDSSISCATISLYPSLEGSPSYREIADIRRMPKVKSAVLSVESRAALVLSNYCTTKFMYPNMGGEFGLRAQYSSDPAYKWQWYVHGSSERDLAECVIQYDCRITYYCVLSRNVGINESTTPT